MSKSQAQAATSDGCCPTERKGIENSSAPNPSTAPDALLTSAEAGIYLGYKSKRTLENLRYRKAGPPFITLSTGAIRYRRSVVDAWVESCSDIERDQFTWGAHLKQQQADKRKARDRERKRLQAAARKAVKP